MLSWECQTDRTKPLGESSDKQRGGDTCGEYGMVRSCTEDAFGHRENLEAERSQGKNGQGKNI